MCEVGGWENGDWKWYLTWRRHLFVWEEELLQELMDILVLANITNVNDRWDWKPGNGEGFTVKSTYVFLDLAVPNRVQRSSLESCVFKFIWKSGAPSKVCALAWQLLLDRIPTRYNLCRRGVVSYDESLCPFCGEEVETTCHLFLHCWYTATIWFDIMRWYGVVSVLPPTMFVSYAMLVGCGSNKKRRKGLYCVACFCLDDLKGEERLGI
jgi:hypothetical protein